MAVYSDMNGFPEGGFPVMANAYDQICLNTIYWSPLVSSGYVIDIVGASRLGSVTISATGALACVGLAAGGAISGATTIAASGTVTLSSATAPLTLSGANAVLSFTGQDSVLSMTGMNSSIGTLLSRIPTAYIKNLDIYNTPTVQGQPVVLQQDLAKVVQSDALFATTSYEDLQVGINNIAKGSSAPTDRVWNHGVGAGVDYYVLGFAKNNFVYFDAQTPHGMKLNSALGVHIHFTLPNTTTVGHKIVWQLDVVAADIDGSWAVPTGSPFTSTYTVATGDNTKHRMFYVGNIPAVNGGMSTVYKCKLTRIDGTATEYASEVYMEYIDCHWQKDSLGSRTEGAK